MREITKMRSCFGLGVYGVYEFTMAAIFEKWELWSVVIDTLWGILCYYSYL